MIEPLVYGLALALFSFVIVATARMSHDMMIVACIPAVFVAIVMGFIMAIYAWDSLGPAVPIVAFLPGSVAAWRLSRRYTPRDLLVAIYLAWTVGLVFALIGVSMPDS